MNRKYVTTKEAYDLKVINDIIGNEPTRIVAIFKDYLLMDDMNDFCRKYNPKESSLK